MTRTQLLEVATKIAEHSVDSYGDASGGVIHTGLYNKRPMHVFVSSSRLVMCVVYNKVAYFVEPVDRRMAGRLKTFYYDYECKEKVFLYPEAKRMFSDEQGDIDSLADKHISRHLDYSDLIPIPYKA